MVPVRLRDVFAVVDPLFWPVVVISLILLRCEIRAAIAAGYTHGQVWISPRGWLTLEVFEPLPEPARPDASRQALARALAGDMSATPALAPARPGRRTAPRLVRAAPAAGRSVLRPRGHGPPGAMGVVATLQVLSKSAPPGVASAAPARRPHARAALARRLARAVSSTAASNAMKAAKSAVGGGPRARAPARATI